MKKLLLSISVLAIIATSCSQQKFAFRKTVRVSEETVKSSPKKKPETIEKIEVVAKDVEQSNETVSVSNIQTTDMSPVVASLGMENSILPASKILLHKSNEVEKIDAAPVGAQKTSDSGDGSGFSVAGFVLSLVGLLVFAVPCGVLAIIFGALGLKSQRRGLAIAAIVIGILDVVLGLIIIANAS